MNQIATKHNLDFEVREYYLDRRWAEFRVGTCEGLYDCDETHYRIFTIGNAQPGNGHFEDVLQWFENSCRRDKKKLKFLTMINKGFLKHLIEKRGFKALDAETVEKQFEP